MKIIEHRESHIVQLEDGSIWQIFPDDIDQTLAWLPTTELRLFEINDEIASQRARQYSGRNADSRAPAWRTMAGNQS